MRLFNSVEWVPTNWTKVNSLYSCLTSPANRNLPRPPVKYPVILRIAWVTNSITPSQRSRRHSATYWIRLENLVEIGEKLKPSFSSQRKVIRLNSFWFLYLTLGTSKLFSFSLQFQDELFAAFMISKSKPTQVLYQVESRSASSKFSSLDPLRCSENEIKPDHYLLRFPHLIIYL